MRVNDMQHIALIHVFACARMHVFDSGCTEAETLERGSAKLSVQSGIEERGG